MDIALPLEERRLWFQGLRFNGTRRAKGLGARGGARMHRSLGVVAVVLLCMGGGCNTADPGVPDPASVDTSDGNTDGQAVDTSDEGTDDEDLDTSDDSTDDESPSARLTLLEGGPLPAPDEVLSTGQGLGNRVRDASHDAAGNLWAVDGSRVYLRRAGMGAFESFGEADGLTGQELLAVGGSVAGTAWVGYRGQGDDAEGEPIQWRGTGGVGRVELSGADVRVSNMLLVSPPGRFGAYPDGRYKLRTCIRAYGVKTGAYAGDAWFGCNHGIGLVGTAYGVEEHHHPILCLWDPATRRCTEKSGWVGAVAFTPDGDVWMGGSYGVMLLDYDHGSGAGHFWGDEPVHNESLFQSPLEPNGYGSQDIVALAVAPDESLWAASKHSGLVHRRADGSVEIYQASDGLPSNRLADIAIDSAGGLWVAMSDAGVIRLDLETGEWRRASGLPSKATVRLVAEKLDVGEKITATVGGAIAVWDGPPSL